MVSDHLAPLHLLQRGSSQVKGQGLSRTGRRTAPRLGLISRGCCWDRTLHVCRPRPRLQTWPLEVLGPLE